MASKLNIFNSLPQHGSDSEEESDFQKTKTKKTVDKKEERNNDKGKDREPKKTGTKQAPPTGAKPNEQKEVHVPAKDTRKPHGVPAEPHPQDRHSGTGQQAFGVKPKKSGAGKGNWGNSKEERGDVEEEVREEQAGEDSTKEKPKEEEKVTLTLAEYYQQQKYSKNEPQVNEAKAKITSEQLMKEVGTATLLKSRNQQEVDDRKAGKKKEHLDINHRAAISTDHADLLNFRTGFIEKEYKQRGPDDFGGPRKAGPRTGGFKGEKENAKEEESQPQTQGQETVATEVVQGEKQQGTTTEVAGEEQQSPSRREQGERGQGSRGQGRGQGNRGGRGGYRGDRQGGDRQGGDRQGGDRQGGDRYQGGKKNYGGKPADQAKINFEDESAFPKLG